MKKQSGEKTLSKKVDFAVIFKVESANPNGDPLNENMPRMISGGFGEVSDVCIKRKIRNRLLDIGEQILIQSDDYKRDNHQSIRARLEEGIGKFKADKKDKSEQKQEETNECETRSKKDEYKKKACKKWMDVRTFGQVLALKEKKSNDESESESNSASIGIRGPVTIQSAFSIKPIDNPDNSIQITKSTNNEDEKKKGPDTMGMKHRVVRGIYVFKGAMNPQLAEKTGFSDMDAEKIKVALPKLFENDASSARPEGSMKVLNVVWWEHNSKCGQYSSADVHASLEVNDDGSINDRDLKGGVLKDLIPEIIQGW